MANMWRVHAGNAPCMAWMENPCLHGPACAESSLTQKLAAPRPFRLTHRMRQLSLLPAARTVRSHLFQGLQRITSTPDVLRAHGEGRSKHEHTAFAWTLEPS